VLSVPSMPRVIRSSETAELTEFFRALCEQGIGDGLPVVPPTYARVAAMLAGRDPGQVVGVLAPLFREVTVEDRFRSPGQPTPTERASAAANRWSSSRRSGRTGSARTASASSRPAPCCMSGRPSRSTGCHRRSRARSTTPSGPPVACRWRAVPTASSSSSREASAPRPHTYPRGRAAAASLPRESRNSRPRWHT
jgi:hypothetical protein